MLIEVEGICKRGKIVPLGDLEIEDNTKVIINVPEKKRKKSFLSLAGVWKDDHKTYETFKTVYKERDKLAY